MIEDALADWAVSNRATPAGGQRVTLASLTETMPSEEINVESTLRCDALDRSPDGCCMTGQSVHRICKAFGLQPHRTETFKLSTIRR